MKIKTLLIVMMTCFFLPAILSAQEVPISGLKGIEVFAVRVEPFEPLAKSIGLNPEVYAAFLEEELKALDLPTAQGDHPLLSLRVLTVKAFWGYSVSYLLSVQTWAQPLEAGPKTRVLATVWQRQGLVYARKGKVAETLNDGLRQGLKRLAQDLKSAGN